MAKVNKDDLEAQLKDIAGQLKKLQTTFQNIKKRTETVVQDARTRRDERKMEEIRKNLRKL